MSIDNSVYKALNYAESINGIINSSMKKHFAQKRKQRILQSHTIENLQNPAVRSSITQELENCDRQLKVN